MPSPKLAASINAHDLKLVRQVRGLTLAETGEAAGIDASALCKIENGKRPLPADVAIRLLRFLFPDGAAR